MQKKCRFQSAVDRRGREGRVNGAHVQTATIGAQKNMMEANSNFTENI